MVFIITSPFPFHFLYKLVQVTCCVPERADQRQPAEMHLQNRSLWSSFITPYSAFPFLCLPSAHPFIFSVLSPPSALFPFIFSPIFVFALLSFFFLFSSFLFFPFFPSSFLHIVSCFFFLPSTFFSPYIILLVLSGSHCYFINFGWYKGTDL